MLYGRKRSVQDKLTCKSSYFGSLMSELSEKLSFSKISLQYFAAIFRGRKTSLLQIFPAQFFSLYEGVEDALCQRRSTRAHHCSGTWRASAWLTACPRCRQRDAVRSDWHKSCRCSRRSVDAAACIFGRRRTRRRSRRR